MAQRFLDSTNVAANCSPVKGYSRFLEASSNCDTTGNSLVVDAGTPPSDTWPDIIEQSSPENPLTMPYKLLLGNGLMEEMT